ncbi:MAG: Mrp/NBP35 family ATP-binding protein [Eubacterium sp.]|nr:Mrp/NBP35 family ATP-binding protein [Eubacterium sp.]
MSDKLTKEQKEAMDRAFAKNMPQDFRKELNEYSSVKKVIGVVSGKGGVGKSLVTSLLAVKANSKGLKTAIMDADITGPSIPKAFGIHKKTYGTEMGIMPGESAKGIKVMSINLLVDNEEDPVIWRGPVIAGSVGQFWTDVYWGDVDVMFVDMPPGTGDVPLTVFQSIPIDGIVVVTSPQELVEMIVGKAVKMAKMMNVPILGIVENMSYFECPDCGRKHEIFGPSRVDEIASAYGIGVTAKMPIDTSVAYLVDKGSVEDINVDWLDAVYEGCME